MEVGMSLNFTGRLPASRAMEETRTMTMMSRTALPSSSSLLAKSGPLFSIPQKKKTLHNRRFVVQAKGKKSSVARQFQRPTPPSLPKIEDDGNPKFVIFIRMASVYLWYPLNVVTGGTTAKIMVAAKDNILGKYIYKDTLARNLAAVIYNDEKQIQKLATKQFRILRSTTEFRYGYKLVEGGNLRAALSPTDVIELPTKDKLKTVLDKVKDFFGDAKESFGKITALNTTSSENSDETSKEISKAKS